MAKRSRKSQRTLDDPLKDHRAIFLRASNMSAEILRDLELRVRDLIHKGELNFDCALAVKGMLDMSSHNMEELQELEAKIRSLISAGDDESWQKAAIAFLDDRVVTD